MSNPPVRVDGGPGIDSRIIEDLEALACWLERNDRDRHPLLVLEAWDIPTADHQGYLEGLKDAATEIRRLVSKWEAA